jgi:UDPglucose 6-dehydrogenase
MILNAVQARNSAQKKIMFEKISAHFDNTLAGKTVALWGLAFKPNTDDMREAPSRVLMESLWEAGAKVQAYDPAAMEETQRIYGQQPMLQLCGTKEAALHHADVLVIMTEWRQFKAPDFEVIKQSLKQAVVFDGRNLFDPVRMQEKGIQYFGIGRPQAKQLQGQISAPSLHATNASECLPGNSIQAADKNSLQQVTQTLANV